MGNPREADLKEKPPHSRRERKREKTRRLIQEAALDLFQSRGFDNVTIADIASAADVDVTTFWRHFGSKHTVLFVDQDEWLSRFVETLDSLPEDMDPFLAGVTALHQTPSVVEPRLEALRTEIRKDNPAPEVAAAILMFEDESKKHMTAALAKRLGVDPKDDARPFMLAEMIIGGARWFRMREQGRKAGKPASGSPLEKVEAIVKSAIDLVPD